MESGPRVPSLTTPMETARLVLRRWELAEPGTERVEIRCDPRNVRSVRVAERLGFTLREVVSTERYRADGTIRELMVWERRAEAVPGEAARS